MQVRVAKVISVKDPFQRGVIRAVLDNSESEITVVYTTPFYSPPLGTEQKSFTGLCMIPRPGANILITKAEDRDTWFYLASIVDGGNLAPAGLEDQVLTGTKSQDYYSYIPDAEVGPYSHSDSPDKYSLRAPNGGNVTISEAANSDIQEKYTRIQSETGKRLILSDSFKHSTLQNEHGDGITITSEGYKGTTLSGRNIRSECEGNNYVTSRTGTAELKGSGRDVRVIANGIPNQFSGPTDGEILVESLHNDVVIRVIGGKGRVFLDAEGSESLIQLRAGPGGVAIYSDGDIDIKCKGDLNLNADGDINLQGSNVHLNPGSFSGKQDPTLNNRDILEGA